MSVRALPLSQGLFRLFSQIKQQLLQCYGYWWVIAHRPWWNELLNAYHAAFLVFDWLLGLHWEVSLFWTGASIGATTLYATTRYMTLLENALFLVQFSQLSGEVSQF